MAETAGVPLRERLPVYERFLPKGIEDHQGNEDADADIPPGNEWVSDRIVRAIDADGEAGERYGAVLRDESLDGR